MYIYFTKFIFFPWKIFLRYVKINEKLKDGFDISTDEKRLLLKHSKKIKRNYLIIKYIPVFVAFLLIINLKEIAFLDLTVFLAPLYAILIAITSSKYKGAVLIFTTISSLSIFFYIDILQFPIFLKYFLLCYVITELYFDVKHRTQYYVYEERGVDENSNELSADSQPVAFAIINIKE